MSQNRITFTLNSLVGVLNTQADRILRTQFEMTFSQFLFLLSLRDGKKSMTEAAKFQGVSVAAVSKRISWFEERGLIKSEVDPHNGRKTLLGLTQKGRTVVDKSSDVLETQFRDVLTDVDGINIQELDKQLFTLLNHFVCCIDES